MATEIVYVRYIVADVGAAMAWYTRHLGFTTLADMSPHFAEIARGSLHLLLSGPTSSAGRRMADGAQPEARRLEPPAFHRRGYRDGTGAAAPGGLQHPQRGREGPRRIAGLADRSVGEPGRDLPAPEATVRSRPRTAKATVRSRSRAAKAAVTIRRYSAATLTLPSGPITWSSTQLLSSYTCVSWSPSRAMRA